MPLRIVFFGSPQFAVPALQSLATDHRLSVDLVVTQPDRPSGRGRTTNEAPVKVAAQALSVPTWQPSTLRMSEALEHLSGYGADLFVVVAYGELFQRSVLALPRCGCLNVHPSLLPRYRGSSPIQAAILNGDSETGVSIIEMIRRLDAGPIVAQQPWPLTGFETGGALGAELADLAARMLPDVAVAWSTQRINATTQDETQASYTRELTKADGCLDWRDDAAAIERKVRAYQPWPMAWTRFAGRRVVIVASEVDGRQAGDEPGSVTFERNEVLVTCGTGSLRLVTVQPEGKGAMPADSWFRGLRDVDDPRFGGFDNGSID